MSERFDYEQFKANAIEQLKAGVPLSGKDGVLAPLLENLLNSALEGEMDSHLEGVEREYGNRRNGHSWKTLSKGSQQKRTLTRYCLATSESSRLIPDTTQ